MVKALILRSLLYAPGNRPDLMEKSLRTATDAVIFDLEDAVPPAEKDRARELVAGFLSQPQAKPVFVRINACGSPYQNADIEALQGKHVASIRIPKCEDPAAVAAIGERLWGDVSLNLGIESAKGYIVLDQLAAAHPRVASVGLGEGDLRSELGLAAEDDFGYARFRLVVASHAAGLGPPMMSAYVRPHDLEGFRKTTLQGKNTGFFGRSAIHPKQIPIINEIFTPSAAEVEDARAMLEAFDAQINAGSGASLLPDGRFIDEAIVRAARTKLELAGVLAGKATTGP